MECVCQNLDELSEVHAFVGYVVENGLIAVTLIFHIAYFHVQAKFIGNLSTLNHGVVLACLCLIILIHIHVASKAIYALYIVSRLEVCFLYLHDGETAGKRNNTDIVTWCGFNGNPVAFFQVKSVDIVVVCLTCILKLYLYKVSTLIIAGNICEPVVHVELMVRT